MMAIMLVPGDVWFGIDGSKYQVVDPTTLGEEPRWFIHRWDRSAYEFVAIHGFDGNHDVGPPSIHDLHELPFCIDCSGDYEIVLALVSWKG